MFAESKANSSARAKAVNMKDMDLFPHHYDRFIWFDQGTSSSPTPLKGRRLSVCVCGRVKVFVETIITRRIKHSYNVVLKSDLSFVGNKKIKKLSRRRYNNNFISTFNRKYTTTFIWAFVVTFRIGHHTIVAPMLFYHNVSTFDRCIIDNCC